MRALCFLLVVSALVSFVPAHAQPEGYVAGSYRLAMTVDGIRYKMTVGGYQISTTVVRGDTIPVLNIWIAAAERSGLPGAAALRGKQASKACIFKETTPGKFQRIALGDVRIQLFSDGGEMIGSTAIVVINPDHHILEVKAPRDVASGESSGLARTLPFGGRTVELTGNDWD